MIDIGDYVDNFIISKNKEEEKNQEDFFVYYDFTDGKRKCGEKISQQPK